MRPAEWPGVTRLVAGFVLGALLVLAFAPFGFGALAVVDLAVFFSLLWHAGNSRMAAWLGYSFGLGLLGFGVFWLRISINQFGGIAPPLGLVFTLLFILIMALFFALMAWIAFRLGNTRGERFFMLVAAPLVWLAVELLRAYLFTGFPWLSVGYSQTDLPLEGVAPLFGVFGVGLLVALSAGLLALWRHRWAIPVLVVLWGAGYALSWVQWTHSLAEEIPVALVQGNIRQLDKWRPSMFNPTLELYQRLTDKAPGARVVIWPETAIPAFTDKVEQSVLRPLDEKMREQGRDLLTGIVSRQPDGRYYNAMLSVGVSGRHAYYKRHLVPFGEYLPLAPLLEPVLDFLDIPMSDFSPGNGEPSPLKLAGYRAGVDICYEDAFGNEVAAALPRAVFLVNASNDAWFGDSLAPHQHLQIARMRALETGRYLLRATNTGISAIIAPDGTIRQQLPQFERTLLQGTIQPMQGMTPYAYWRDTPLLMLSMVLIPVLWLTRRRV